MGDQNRHKIACCCCFLLMIAVIATPPLYFYFRRYDSNHPSPYIEDFYVPSLVVPVHNKTTTVNTSVFVDLKFERAAALTRYRYRYIQMRLLYDQHIRVGTCNIEGFSMGRKKQVHVKAAVEAVDMPWEVAQAVFRRGDAVSIVVELKMNPEPCTAPWVAYVDVDASGHMKSKKPIKLKRPSWSYPRRSGKCDWPT